MNINSERYHRQVALREFGKEKQQKLFASKILAVGIGGLGCPALVYLAAAGVGTIGIADDDVVCLSNVHRQILFTAADAGKPKTSVACERLQQINAEINVIVHEEKITNINALEIIKDYDIVLDGTDNFPSRYVINDACVLLGKPLISGSVSRFEGQVSVLNVRDENNVQCNYRDIFSKGPQEQVLNCSEEGVLGVLTGIIGTMQAAEAIKLLTGLGKPLINQMLVYNLLNAKTDIIALTENKKAYTLPANAGEFAQMNYEMKCISGKDVQVIDAIVFKQMINENDALFVDVREPHELPLIDFVHKKMPLSQFEKEVQNINESKVVFFCQTGKRSREAARMLFELSKEAKEIYCLQEGVLSLNLKAW